MVTLSWETAVLYTWLVFGLGFVGGIVYNNLHGDPEWSPHGWADWLIAAFLVIAGPFFVAYALWDRCKLAVQRRWRHA